MFEVGDIVVISDPDAICHIPVLNQKGIVLSVTDAGDHPILVNFGLSFQPFRFEPHQLTKI